MVDDEATNRPLQRNGGSRPVPDPTELTDRAIARLERSLTESFDGKLAVRDERLRGIDEATKLRLGHVESFDDVVDLKVGALKELHAALFAGIATQFQERDTRTEQAAEESRISLDAALAAAKEAVSEQNKANALAIGKSEDATKERLDALALLMTTSIRSLEDKIGDLKGRFDRGEGNISGASETRTEARLSTGMLLGIGSLFVGAVVTFVAVAAFMAP